MIDIRELTKSFHNNIVLNDINLTITTGEVIAIIGPSGSGKSTFLRCLNFLEIPEKGVIRIDNFEIDAVKATPNQIRTFRQYSGMVFQQFNLFRRKTALENVMEGLIVVKKIPKKEARELALRQIEKVGLSDRTNHYPKQLSGGQQQRVAIARALAMKPNILLFDEPTSALDPELVGEVLETIRAAAQDGNTMIIVSHEMNFVRKVANRVLFLDDGKIIEDGTPKEVFERPKNARTKEFLRRVNKFQEIDYAV
jgi:polar amino acid transport system ATP-binding protein